MISKALGVKGNELTIGGVEVSSLAKKYGTPLYIMDEDLIRETISEYNAAMKKYYGDNFLVLYASKAFSAKYIYTILNDLSTGADVVSGGELYTAKAGGFDMSRVYFHGNNKTAQELEMGLDYGIHCFVVDNKEELKALNALAEKKGVKAKISFRIKPGIDAHTHDFVMTGQIDSKFGVALEDGSAIDIVEAALGYENLDLIGVHCHIGSQIFDRAPFELAAEVMMDFVREVKVKFGHEISELNLGGGFGIKYLEEHDPRDIDEIVKTAVDAVRAKAGEFGLKEPKLIIEPGRSIVAPSGITVYTVGAVKEIKGIRTYASIDGGMTDNPRFALYESQYTIEAVQKMDQPKDMVITLAGRCCESGDLIGRDMQIQKIGAGDLVAVLATGAYNYSMASNYNRVPRPPVIMVSGGKDKVIVERETFEDIIKNDK